MTRKSINRPSENRTAVQGRAIALAFLLVLGACTFLTPKSALAARAEVNDVFLMIDDYTNDSIVDAWAALNFTEAPIPPPSQVDDILFEWFAPSGAMVNQETVNPNDQAWAPSSFRVTHIGQWMINATYTTNTSVHESLSFNVLPEVWGPGQVMLGLTTVVGRTGELTIAPGTDIRFPTGGALRVQGKITAIGTGGQPIVFTSNESAPVAGDWNVISFLETAENSSRISQARLSYSTGGIRIKGASPAVDNVTFSDNNQSSIDAEYSMSSLRDLTIAGGAYGIDLAGCTMNITSVTITGANYGLRFQGGGGLVSDVNIAGSAQTGLLVNGATVSISDSAFGDNQIGIRADASTVTAEAISSSRDRIAVQAVQGASVFFSNSSIVDAGLRQYSASGASRIFARNVQLSPPTPILRDITDTSLLVIQSYLWVTTRLFDTGLVLSGATVEFFEDSTLVGTLLTGAGGAAGPIALTYGSYDATTFIRKTTVVSVGLTGYAFANNSRIVNMASSHSETFNGSIHDYDRDGNPDFNDSDDDNDGLSDQVELQIGTDPRSADTDHDGMPDKWEYDEGFDPTNPADGNWDADGDGLSNKREYQYGTDPNNPDSDGDGMPDGWEVRYGLNPLDPTDASKDSDFDDYSNLDEYLKGTNPRSAESRPPYNPNLGLLGAGDYWPIALVPLVGLGLMVVFVVLLYLLSVPRKRRGKSPPPELEKET